jgi:hypothetical protein
MFLFLCAGFLGGGVAFGTLSAQFGFFAALVGSPLIASAVALAAGACVAWRRAETPHIERDNPPIDQDELVDALRRLSNEARRHDTLGTPAQRRGDRLSA